MTTDLAQLDEVLWAAREVAEPGAEPLVLPALPRTVASSDDLFVAGERLLVRASIRADDVGNWVVDLRDSSPASGSAAAPTLVSDDVALAAVAAFSHALRIALADRRLVDRMTLLVEPSSWVGAAVPGADVAARLFAMARVYDAIIGALAQVWTDPGRAGSCSLGAIVRAHGDGVQLLDVVAGGRGAGLREAGTPAWSGPIVPAGLLRCVGDVDVTHDVRARSGGGGARSGGDGVRAVYRFGAPAELRVALDRITNPPHGLDRAGPPEPAAAWLLRGDAEPTALAPWVVHTVQTGDVVEIHTAGGAGHGFPGWGIDFDWE